MNTDRPRVCLYEPRIPQNTGNISRSCAAFKYKLDLIKPLGFSLEDKYLKRAGLDYWQYVDINLFDSFDKYKSQNKESRIIAFSRFSNQTLVDFEFKCTDILMFGREDTGLPADVKDQSNYTLSIPMPGGVRPLRNDGVRSLNLSVACGIVIYKSCEQLKLFDFST